MPASLLTLKKYSADQLCWDTDEKNEWQWDTQITPVYQPMLEDIDKAGVQQTLINGNYHGRKTSL